jgi:WD40 repeat protein
LPILDYFTVSLTDAVMASTSTKVAATKSILTPSITLRGHGDWIPSISYFPDGQRMISGSEDKTARQWDLKAGKEIKDARSVCEGRVYAVAVSSDGRWVVTGGGDGNLGELKACEVKTGIVKVFEGHSQRITCVDISTDNTLLTSGAMDCTTRIWNLDTGKLVAGSFKSIDWVGTVRLSMDSKKLAVKSDSGACLEVWNVQSQKLDVKLGEYGRPGNTFSPVFWTNNNKTIIAAFRFTEDDPASTIYEFDALTLETVGTPFEGHTSIVRGLALSFDGALLASTSKDNTIKLWAFESRQLLASFDVQNLLRLILSPDSCQLAYTIITEGDYKICICDTPPDVLAQARVRIPCKHLLSVC